MDLTTRPPGAAPGAGPAATPTPVLRELRAIVEELRALTGPGSVTRPLPALAELRGAAPEPALARWFRAALDAGTIAAPALKTLVDQAVERLAVAAAPAAAATPDTRLLEGAREVVLRLLAAVAAEVAAGPRGGAPPPAAAAAPVDIALALRMLAEEVRRAVVAQIGAEPPFVAAPAAAEDPGNAGAALLGWLRAAAARAGVPLEALGPAIDTGAERALALLPGAAGSAALAAARDVIGRGLEAARAPGQGGESAPVTLLVAEIATAVSEALGPAVALAEAVETGAERALRALGGATADPASRAAVAAARAWVSRGLQDDAGGPQLLYRPDLAATSAAATRIRGRGGDSGQRVLAIGEDERPDGRGRRPTDDGRPAAGGAPEAGVPGNPTEGPMQCIRRCLDALNAGDAAAFAAAWVYPACFWIDGRWFACVDETALGLFQARMLRARRDRGIVGGRILLLRVDPVSATAALVHVLMGEEHGGDAPLREVEWLYTTVRTDDGWRVASAIAK